MPGVGPLGFEVAAGECVGLSGPSGSGKTRMLRAIADLDEHTGTVRLDGMPCERYPPWEWRRRVALLPAENHWWLERVEQHIPHLDDAALARVGLSRAQAREPVASLSSGERQRFAVLRVLANRPSVLLLDEPTANLDAASAERVEALLADYRREAGAAVVWVSHDAGQIGRVARRRLDMRDGRLEEAAP